MKRILFILLLLPSLTFAAETNYFPLQDNGTIPAWTVIGPFPNEPVPQTEEQWGGYFKDYLTAMGGEANAVAAEGDVVSLNKYEQRKWQTGLSQPNGLLDFIDILKVSKDAPGVAYAFCWLRADKKQDMLLNIRSNDGVKAWLNHKLVHDHHVGRSIESEEDHVKVTLRKGNNPLLVKVDQRGGDWGLVLSVTKKDGTPATGIKAGIKFGEKIKGKILSASFHSQPLIVKTAHGNRQILSANIASGGVHNLVCKIKKKEWENQQIIQIGDLPLGSHDVKIELPVFNKSEPASILLESPTSKFSVENVALKKAEHWSVYFVQHVHTDIGYTRPQTEILPEHLRYIDYALDFCDQTDNYPDDAKFRWTCEVSWAVREYLRRRPASQIARLKKRVAEGRIEVTGMFLNMAEIANESLLAASLQPIRDIENQGMTVQTAMQDDVNGIGWCLVDYFSDIGIKYVTMGINKTRSVLPFDKPTAFWWESPSGKRVLAFRAEHYHLGNFLKIHTGQIDAFRPRFLDYLSSLEKKKFPFREMSIQFSGYHTDNSPPSTKACEIVKAWNEQYAWPKLRIATVHEFLQDVAKKHADELPVYRASWPDWWTDGFGSAARETAEARKTQSDLKISEGLFSMAMLRGGALPAAAQARMAAIQDALLFYDEHTFGAAESISDPLAENSKVQWGEKSSYVWNAVKQTAMLHEEAMGLMQQFLPKSDVPTIAVFNTLNWSRSGLVNIFIDHQILPLERKFEIIDMATNEAVPVQNIRNRTEGTYWALWAEDVPPLGYKMFRIVVHPEKKVMDEQTNTGGVVLENHFYKLILDQSSGAMKSLFDKALNRELVDSNAPWKWGQFIYEQSKSGRNFTQGGFVRTGLKNVQVDGIKKGAVWQSIFLHGDADGCVNPNGIKLEIRLYETEKRLELYFDIRKKESTQAQALYVSFPFRMQGWHMDYEAQGGAVQPGVNQLPGSASDWQTVQHFISVKNKDAQIILGSNEIPLVQLGDINLGKWQYICKVERPTIYSWVMNNYWFTNFRANQDGEFKFGYYLTSLAHTSSVASSRFGWASQTPLAARVFPAGTRNEFPPMLSSFARANKNLLLIEARPANYSGAIILHFRETAGTVADLDFSHFLDKKIESIDIVNALEKPLQTNVTKIIFQPLESKFIRINLMKRK